MAVARLHYFLEPPPADPCRAAVIPEDMIITIMETPVSEVIYLEHLQNLEHKINFLNIGNKVIYKD